VGINATLIGQMVTFSLFVIFTMKWVWPPLNKALKERQQKIADGLAAAERGKHELELAQHKATDSLREAKLQAAHLIEQADKRAALLIEQAKEQARLEGKRLLEVAHGEIAQAKQSAREALRREIVSIAVSGAEKILKINIDTAANNAMIDELIAEVSSE
jgi:F-type H+-transporting ATPase subunit b